MIASLLSVSNLLHEGDRDAYRCKLVPVRYDGYSEKHVYVASTFEEGEDSYKYEKLEGDS
jgi:hypothetical protein